MSDSFLDVLCDPKGLLEDPVAPPVPFKSPTSLDRYINDSSVASSLFQKGHFTQAIITTSKQIPQSREGGSVEHILNLWYIRIQCLLILQLGHQAAEEINHNLNPLDSERFKNEFLNTIESRYRAWRLRLLLVPVKTKGINQSAIQNYYALGLEARQEAAETPEKQEMWLSAAKLAGIYALSTLIALRDYVTAIHLLRTHYNATNDPQLAKLLGLLHIILGDSLGAQAWFSKINGVDIPAELQNLINFADQTSSAPEENDISKVYDGYISQSISILEEQVVQSHTENGLIVNVKLGNLFVLYNLCFADSREAYKRIAKKLEVAGNLELESIELSTEFRRAL